MQELEKKVGEIVKSYKTILHFLIIISSFLLTNCFVPPNAVLKLRPKTEDIEWYKGKEIATVTNDSVSIIISYDRSLNDDYLFDVDIINYSEKTLLVEPEKFYYKMISGTIEQNELLSPTVAKDPEKVILDLQKAYALHQSQVQTQTMIYSLGYFLQFAAQTKALVTNDAELSEEVDERSHRMRESELIDDIQNQRVSESLDNSTYMWEILTLRKTNLRKDESISGKVFFPVKERAKTLEFCFPIGEYDLKISFDQEVYFKPKPYVDSNLVY